MQILCRSAPRCALLVSVLLLLLFAGPAGADQRLGILESRIAAARAQEEHLSGEIASLTERIRELENELGCYFDRNPDGTIHQKAFAGQTFDRTVHKGDLTGIEIMNRLTEQAQARPSIRPFEECRAVELLSDDAGRAAGALLLDIRTGRFVAIRARATLLAMGGGPTMYRVIACSADKAADGIALAYRAGLPLRDMEMIQFHPTGLVIPGSLMTGALLEEGLRGAGGQLRNAKILLQARFTVKTTSANAMLHRSSRLRRRTTTLLDWKRKIVIISSGIGS